MLFEATWLRLTLGQRAALRAVVLEHGLELLATGVLAKETQTRTIRFAPPLTTNADELEWVLERVNRVVAGL